MPVHLTNGSRVLCGEKGGNPWTEHPNLATCEHCVARRAELERVTGMTHLVRQWGEGWCGSALGLSHNQRTTNVDAVTCHSCLEAYIKDAERAVARIVELDKIAEGS